MTCRQDAVVAGALGLPDECFEQRKPLRGQITKREVRAVSLYLLGLRRESVVWDIGAGTGSVSIEAGKVADKGCVFAVERDSESVGLLRRNVDRLAGPNVRVVYGEAPAALADLPDPDSVFIGGSGGNLPRILEAAAGRMRSGGTVVVNLAALERTHEVYHFFKDRGMPVELTSVSSSRGKDMPDGTVRLEALNPVFIVSARPGNLAP